MNRTRFLRRIMLAGTVALASSLCAEPVPPSSILCTTFPIYQLVRNVTQGRDGAQVQLLLPSQLGCPHDYVLSPQDMQKLVRADVLVVNGLGLEEFLGAPLEKANAKLRIIDSSAGVGPLIAEGVSCDHGCTHAQTHNPHPFASPRMAAKLVLGIGSSLVELDPAGASIYTTNAAAYAKVLDGLADEFAALGQRVKNKRIVQSQGIFDYLARDAQLEIVAVIQLHGEKPSAAKMAELVHEIREKRPGAIFAQPQYPAKVAHTLAAETGVAFVSLDPVATGPTDAPLDYYETTMRRNLEILECKLKAKAP